MSIYYYHPLGDFAGKWPQDTNKYNTYSDGYHVAGELDMQIEMGTPQYAMCNGIITSTGKWDDGHGTTYATLECKGSQNGLGETFYIRYLHGDYTVKVGQSVKTGDKIGTTAMHGDVTGPHLHLGFTYSRNGLRDPTVTGQLKIKDNHHYYIYNGKEYALDDDKVDWNLIEDWKKQLGVGNNDIGYCWLVMASKFVKLKPNSTSTNKKLDVSSSFKSDNDWMALYGLLQSEEGQVAKNLKDEKNAAIFEWVVRVARNRLFSGITIQQLPLWGGGQDYNSCVALGKYLPSEARKFAKNIISGQDYFYVEKVAQNYRWSETKNWSKEKWFNRLYSATQFCGGNTHNGYLPLAAIPFAYGPYFFMQCPNDTSSIVWNKFWPNGENGEPAYPNPYLSR